MFPFDPNYGNPTHAFTSFITSCFANHFMSEAISLDDIDDFLRYADAVRAGTAKMPPEVAEENAPIVLTFAAAGAVQAMNIRKNVKIMTLAASAWLQNNPTPPVEQRKNYGKGPR